MSRARINIRPIVEADHRLHAGLLASVPLSAETVALSVAGHPQALDGVLVQVRHTGTYAMWRGLTLEAVDQRKARAAIDAMGALAADA